MPIAPINSELLLSFVTEMRNSLIRKVVHPLRSRACDHQHMINLFLGGIIARLITVDLSDTNATLVRALIFHRTFTNIMLFGVIVFVVAIYR